MLRKLLTMKKSMTMMICGRKDGKAKMHLAMPEFV